jgi:hypothetical protein
MGTPQRQLSTRNKTGGMMNKLVGLLLLGFAINAAARASAGKEVASLAVGTAVLGAICAIVGTLWRWDIIYAFVALYLAGSIVMNAQPLLTFFTKILGGIKK